jgi:pyruvate/2-oxoglutarate dehydrogenase complex dihydrolipoamide dehydrogenase (E3) component
LTVIGAGPAGITAALEGAALGAQVTLVSAEPVGGRANWHSLVPSKVALTAADHLQESRHLPAMGLRGSLPAPDLPTLRQRIAEQAQAWSRHYQDLLKARGVTLISAMAHFQDSHHIQLEQDGTVLQDLAFDRAIIATGSEPIFLPQLKPDGKFILAPRHISQLSSWPQLMIVIGGGVTGAEFSYFFNGMGCQVTWVTDLATVLPRTDPDLTETLEQGLRDSGVEILKSAPVQSVTTRGDSVAAVLKDGRTLSGSHAFLAIGRKPDLTALTLESAGVSYTAQGIDVDPFGRTSVPHIFAAGDVTGPPFIANRGQAQARVATRQALGTVTGLCRSETVIEAVYTRPQIAQVGLTEAQAANEGRPVKVFKAAYREALKPRLSGDNTTGFVKILAAPTDGRILGGAGVGDRAAEVISLVAVAIAADLKVEHLAALFPAYPTLSELVGIALRGY